MRALVTSAVVAAATASPQQALAAGSMLSPQEQGAYRGAGTWSALFDPGGLENQVPLLVWALSLVLLGAVAFPYVWLAARSLPDLGLAFARPLGLLLVAWPVWLAARLGVAEFSRASIAVVTLALAAGAALIALRTRRELAAALRDRWHVLAAGEAAFWLLFLAVVGVRWLNPDLWHPQLGGEKPMDLAYLNAVIKSPQLPPFDPWFAGGSINYYYLGFVLVAVLVKLTAVVPAVAYNLAIATFAAMLGSAAFGVAAALASGRRIARPRAVAGGLFALLFVAVAGNLGELHVLRDRLDGAVSIERWYWAPSRAIGAPVGEPGPISEFPAFTYLYADLHAHAMALPYTAVVLGLAVAAARARAASRGARLLLLGLLALSLGALWPLNTWDVPTYALLAGIVLVAGAASGAAAGRGRRLAAASGQWLAVVATGYLAFLPFHRDYVSSFAGVERWRGAQTSLGDYLTVHGLFLFTIGAALVVHLVTARDLAAPGRAVRMLLRRPRRAAALQRALVRPQRTVLMAIVAVAAGVTAATAFALAREGPAALAVALLVLVALSPERRAAMLWHVTLALIGLALALTVAVEYLVVADIDIGRTNTVFKTYLQVWVLLGIGAAVAATRVYAQRYRLPRGLGATLRSGFVALLFVALLYPALATPAKIRDRFDRSVGPTLDGMAFMERAVHVDKETAMPLDDDLEAIRWFLRAVEGSPVVAEVNTYPTLYGWGNRYAMFTGNPSVVGWDFHQRQQRPGAAEEVLRRVADVQEAYATRDPDRAHRILRRYDVEYVVVGPLERAYFPAGQAKWQTRAGRLWDRAYRNEGVTVYRLRDLPSSEGTAVP